MDELPVPHNQPEPDYARRKKIAWGIFTLLFLGILLGGVYYWFVYRFYESTENAYVKSDLTWIMPKVSGEVLALYVHENQTIEKGKPLVALDNRDLQARADQAKAMVNLKQAGLSVQTENEKSAQASIQEAQSARDAAAADVSRLSADFRRYQQLLKEGVITRQRFEATQAEYLTAQAQLNKAQAAIQAAQAQFSSVQAGRTQLYADLDNAKATVKLYDIDLNASEIVAPVSGKVGSLAVQIGSRVNPQTRLMAIIPKNSLYVEANFKETQIEKMRAGQRVSLVLDAYPSLTFNGQVQSFSPASGATFSMMPPDNATGNFNKVVQRIPVRISILPHPQIDLIKPGMSVVAKVDLRS